MKTYSFLIVLCLLCLCSLQTGAQPAKKYVYIDSSEISKDDITDTTQENDEDYNYIDTSLENNKLFLSADSVRKLKNDPVFEDTKSLDSMLLALQRNQKKVVQETVADNGPGWLEGFFSSKITKGFFLGLAILFISLIVYKLFFTEGFFQRQTAISKVKLLKEEEELPSKEKDFDAMIARAFREADYRQATRYLYLQLLQKLSVGGAIVFAADKTNAEYLRELQGKPYKQEVAALTLFYEYVWYGGFVIDGNAFSQWHDRFKKLNLQA